VRATKIYDTTCRSALADAEGVPAVAADAAERRIAEVDGCARSG
jgi:hypothetical protein